MNNIALTTKNLGIDILRHLFGEPKNWGYVVICSQAFGISNSATVYCLRNRTNIPRIRNSVYISRDGPKNKGRLDTIFQITKNKIWIFYEIALIIRESSIMLICEHHVVAFECCLYQSPAAIFIAIARLLVSIFVPIRINIACEIFWIMLVLACFGP
ncbi:hypothetical protein WI41_25060 [Burkholderia latens]|uniref:Uncharacterized protein n=1 Tax=Burkholderia latens TaxID=488446 RepID=A0AAP1G618_9BURK|nr:hypothetical protein WI41_25060 [Burkholderia latens]